MTPLLRNRPLALPKAQKPAPKPAQTAAIPNDSLAPSRTQAAKTSPLVVDAKRPSSTRPSGLSSSVDDLLNGEWGCQASRADFENIVADALPGRTPLLTLSTDDFRGQKCLRVQCHWLDGQAEEAAHWSASLSKEPDGSLKLYWGGTWTRPEDRSKGTLEKLTKGNIVLLKKLSGHPQDVLEISAGASGQTGQFVEQEVVGRYLWARLGVFEFADNESRERLQTSFASFLNENSPLLTPTLVEQLQRSSQTWNRPDQFAEVDPPFLKLPVTRADGRVRQCSLGKAFLLDARTPAWSGRCRPNQMDPANLERALDLLSWTSKGTVATDAPPPPHELAAKLKEQLKDPNLKSMKRCNLTQKLAQLTGVIDIPGYTAASEMKPSIIEDVLRSEIAKNEQEPMGLLQNSHRLAVLHQEAEYRERFSQGGPVDEAEFRRFLVRHDGNYQRMDAALSQPRSWPTGGVVPGGPSR